MLHNRKNIRLRGYDYSRAGLYFLTIVVQKRLYLFGHIENDEMILNDAGRMIEKWYREIEMKFHDKRCKEMVVMPNHFHCIIEIVEPATQPEINKLSETDEKYGIHNQKNNATIGDVMDWFKTMTTNAYIRGVKEMNWRRFDEKLWQRNYYDHIIRDWEDDIRISNYIAENPRKWKGDRFHGSE